MLKISPNINNCRSSAKMNLKLFQNVKWHKENVAIIVSFKSEGIYCGAKERLLPGPLTGPWEGL